MQKSNDNNKETGVEKVIEQLRSLADSGFYGRVEIVYEAGNVVVVRKTETMKFDRM